MLSFTQRAVSLALALALPIGLVPSSAWANERTHADFDRGAEASTLVDRAVDDSISQQDLEQRDSYRMRVLSLEEQADAGMYADQELIVVYEDGATDTVKDRALDSVDVAQVETLSESAVASENEIALVTVAESQSVAEAVATVEAQPGVAYAQPNYRYRLVEPIEEAGTSDDTDNADALGTAGAVESDSAGFPLAPLSSESALSPLAVTVNDPAANPNLDWNALASQWWLQAVKAPEAWEFAKTEGAVSVAVFDSPIYYAHEDLQANIDTERMYDVVREQKLELCSDEDYANIFQLGHGTHVAGIIAGVANNGTGIAGVSYNAKVLPVNVMKTTPASTPGKYNLYTDDKWVIKAFEYLYSDSDGDGRTVAQEANVRVVNMSLGGYLSDIVDDPNVSDETRNAAIADDKALHAAVTKATGAGILCVCAAGNAARETMAQPSDYDECVSVTAATISGEKNPAIRPWTYSDHNQYKDITAPGAKIYSTFRDGTPGQYGRLQGTSMASPMVAGAAALLFAYKPGLSAPQAKDALESTARDIGLPEDFGHGFLDVSAALGKVAAGSILPVPANLKVQSSSDNASIELSWEASTGAASYTIERSQAIGGPFETLGTAAALTYVDETAKMSVAYYYRVVPVSSDGERGFAAMSGEVKLVADKSALKAAIRTAQADVDATVEATSGAGLSYNTLWATAADKSTLRGAIAAAQRLVNDSSATQVQVNEGVAVLESAVAAFDAAKKHGDVHLPAVWERLSGDDALGTMSAIVGDEAGFSDKGGMVVVAAVSGYWDALSASGIAGLAGAPVLMTAAESLSDATKAELVRLQPSQVIICGGPFSVSQDVADQIQEVTGTAPVRIAGESATGTAARIAKEAKARTGGTWSSTGLLATNAGYWDALAIAPYAYHGRCPIFLSEGADSVSEETISAMREVGIFELYIVGGELSVSPAVKAQLEGAGIRVLGRLSGETAIETSQVIAEFELSHGMTADKMGVATVDGYWDALSGAAFCGKNGSVIVLVSDEASSSIDGFVKTQALSIERGYVFGGMGTVPESVLERLRAVTK